MLDNQFFNKQFRSQIFLFMQNSSYAKVFMTDINRRNVVLIINQYYAPSFY